ASSSFGEPVQGGLVHFSAPASGPSATFPAGSTGVIDASGQACVAAAANNIAGSYAATASANGAVPVSFSLTNFSVGPFTVTNLTDHDAGSLRDRLATIAPGGTIDFQSGLSGMITLTTGPLTIAKDVIIAGSGNGLIKVSGNQTFQVFVIAPGVTVTL